MFKVFKSQHQSGKTKLLSREAVEVEEHTRCKCDCKKKESDCNKYQRYNKAACSCVCINIEDQRKCADVSQRFTHSIIKKKPNTIHFS